MMTREDRQEALSLASVRAVAAACGMTHEKPSKDYGIDLRLNHIREEPHHFFESGLLLDLQLKSTTAVVESPTTVGYDLKVKGYNCLRFPSLNRRLLVLSVLPADESEWVRHTPTRLELRQRVYWVSLRGQPPVKNRSSVRITIPKRHRFTADGAREIIAAFQRGEEL